MVLLEGDRGEGPRGGTEGRKRTREAVCDGGVGEEPGAGMGRGDDAGSDGFGREAESRPQ